MLSNLYASLTFSISHSACLSVSFTAGSVNIDFDILVVTA